MKKRNLYQWTPLILALCMALMVVGCGKMSPVTDENKDETVDVPAESGVSDDVQQPSSSEDEEMSESNQEPIKNENPIRVEFSPEHPYDGKGKTLIVMIVNETEEEIRCDPPFRIERQEGDAWVIAMKNPVSFPEVIQYIGASSKSVRLVNLVGYCGELIPGNYRYTTEIFSDGEWQTYVLEFTVE